MKQILSGGVQENSYNLKRKDVSNLLDISMDTLQNWEMNGLLTVKRKNNGYRVYTDEDIQRLKNHSFIKVCKLFFRSNPTALAAII